jgi:REP element-mobilizing transposase RayT
LSYRKVVAALKRAGFSVRRQKGSHIHLLAPKGPWAVATGGAAARRSPPTRNPWNRDSLILFSPRRGNAGSIPGTYTQVLLHITCSTEHREPWITPDLAARLYPYIGGIVRAEKGVLYDIGGIADHVHTYLRWRPDATVSELMRTVKAPSSKWIHDTLPNLSAFAWQEGYSVFAVSKSQEEAVKKYIAGQAEHHKKEDFKTELLRILRAY